MQGQRKPATIGVEISADTATRTCRREDPHCTSQPSSRADSDGASAARALRRRSTTQLIASRSSIVRHVTAQAAAAHCGTLPAAILMGKRGSGRGAVRLVATARGAGLVDPVISIGAIVVTITGRRGVDPALPTC
jgi:hypothetical protein